MKRFIMMTFISIITMSAPACAEDIEIKVPAGEGIVTFSQGDEIDISKKELIDLVNDALDEYPDIRISINGEAEAELNNGEARSIEASGIGGASVEKSGERVHADLQCKASIFGKELNVKREACSWNKDGMTRSAISTGDGDWLVTYTRSVEDLFYKIKDRVDILEELEPADHIYELDGRTFYVCKADSSILLNEVKQHEKLARYAAVAKLILGKNDPTLTVLIDTETGLPHVVTIDASDMKGAVLPVVFGSAAEYETQRFYITAFIEENNEKITIPEDVRSTKVRDFSMREMLLSKAEKAVKGLLQTIRG